MNKQAPRVKCPSCGNQSLYSSTNPWRPFCSERCKRIDLGAWASEQFRVPDRGSSTPSTDTDFTEDAERLH
jgi:uncharacterized protein